jgi:hypothetical protein
VELKRVLAIDPGINTGLAWLEGERVVIDSYSNKATGDIYRVYDLATELQDNLDIIHERVGQLECIVIESAEIFGGSLKSMTAGTRGNISLLAYIIGAYLFVCQEYADKVELVDPRTWKGQLPYPALVKHLDSQFDIHVENDHEAAAAGILLWKLGKF